MNTLLLGLVFSAIMAGCAQAGAKEAETSSGPQLTVAHDDNTGSISGAVIDDTLLPIEGVRVSLLTPNGTAVYKIVNTDASGKFAFSYIPAGDYKVEAKMPGYEVALTAVKVNAGEIVPVTFHMKQGFADVAFFVTDHLSRMIGGGTLKYGFECSTTPWYSVVPTSAQSTAGKYCIGNNACAPTLCSDQASGCMGSYSKETGVEDNGYGGDNYNGGYRDLLRNQTDWKAQIAELSWTQSSAISGRGVLFEILGPNVTNSAQGDHTSRCSGINQSDHRDFLVISDKPPMRLEVNQAVMDARGIAAEDHCCDWRFRLFPGWCDLGNCARWGPDANVLGAIAPTRVEVYYTLFFKEAPPPGWTSLSDG